MLEYLSRTSTIREFTTFPCSVFVTNTSNGEKIVFSIEKYKTNSFKVKKWYLSEVKLNGFLPKSETFLWEDVFEEIKNISSHLSLMKFTHKGYPARENSYNHPMSEDRFKLYYDGYMSNFSNHNMKKEYWLWNAYVSLYFPELVVIERSIKRNLRFFGELAEKEIYEDQKRSIKNKEPKKWNAWLSWKRNMLNFAGIPGELVFRHVF